MTAILIVCTAACIFLALLPRIRRRILYNLHELPYPPGPRGLPLLGNALDNPGTERPPYKDWAKKYGPVAFFRLLTQDVIVINTRETAYDLLDKRAGAYSDRPRQVMCGELMSWNRGIALCPAGPRHRTYRRLVNRTLSASASKALWEVQTLSARRFLTDLSLSVAKQKQTTGYEFLAILRRSVGMNVVGIIYGTGQPAEDVDNNNTMSSAVGMSERDMEDYIDRADTAHDLFAKALVPFAYMVDWLPFLKYVPEYFPFATFKKVARVAREDLEHLTVNPYVKTRRRISRGISRVSYIDSCIASNPNPSLDEEESMAWTAMSAYTGGSDTTIASLTTVFLAAALHPEIQALAHAELDEIVGQERMPGMEDRDHLPYLNAFVQECMRSSPVVPLGVPHRAMEDDTLEGFFVPKGATIIANIRGMLHDPAVYKSPLTFDPTRFLPTTGTPTNPFIRGRGEPDIGSLPFGFGRRICPGMHLATSGVWIYTASLLWAFKISLREENRGPGEQSLTWETAKFSEGAILYPLPFKVDLVARSEAIDTLLNRTSH